jgi:hypothetical protein
MTLPSIPQRGSARQIFKKKQERFTTETQRHGEASEEGSRFLPSQCLCVSVVNLLLRAPPPSRAVNTAEGRIKFFARFFSKKRCFLASFVFPCSEAKKSL